MRRIACLLALLSFAAVASATAGTFGPPRSRGGSPTHPSATGDLVWFPYGAGFDVWNYADPTLPVPSRIDLTAALEGPIVSSTIAGSALCIGWFDGPHIGVRVFSLADPTHPVFASDIAFDQGYTVAADGATLYVFLQSGGLAIYDVSDPANPVALSSVAAYDDLVSGLRIAGGRVYTWASGGTIPAIYLTIYDVHDPAHPNVLADSLDLRNIFGIGDPTDDGFVPATGDGFSMLDARDPGAITTVYDDGSGLTFMDAKRKDTMLYVASGGTIATWNVSQPTAPQHIGDTADDAFELLLFDDGLLAFTYGLTGALYDTSTAPLAAPLSTINVPSSVGASFGVRDDAHVYTQSFGAFQVLDVETLEPLGAIDPASGEGQALVYIDQLDIVGDTVFVIGHGLTAIDVSDPTTPEVVGTLATAIGTGVANGTRAYVHDSGAHTLTVVDTTHPTSMRAGGVLQGDFEVYAARDTVAFAMNPLYVGIGDPLKLNIIDARDATRPIVAGSYQVCSQSNTIKSLAANDDGNYVAVLCDTNVVEIYGVRNPGSPTAVSTITGYATAVGWKGPHLYVGAHAGAEDLHGVDVYDIAQPSSPQLVAHLDLPDTVQQLGSVHAFSLSPNGGMLATMGYTGLAVADCDASIGSIECGPASTASGLGHSHHARPSRDREDAH
jgi:hypothetical protein